MYTNQLINTSFLLFSGLLVSSCQPSPVPPAGSSNLAQGNVETTDVDCNSTLNSNLLKDMCSVFECTPKASCATRAEELFTGNTLIGNSSLKAGDWSYMGGRGELMANGALCSLRDLADGSVGTQASASLLGGALNFSIEQQVGYESFDVDQKKFTGYQTARVCVPVIGCFDSNRQGFTAQVVESLPADPSGLSCGNYKIGNSFGLQIKADETNQSIVAALPSITIDTPYGDILVTPAMGYTVQMQSVLMPLGEVSADLFPEAALSNVSAQSTELLGRVNGTKTTASLKGGGFSLNRGWQSQVALGGRDANASDPIWNGAGVRPDQDLSVARNDAEHAANVVASASINVDYSPTDIIPSFLKASPLSVDFDVFAKTNLNAFFTEQFAIFFGEGFRNPTDIGPVQTETAFRMKSRSEAYASMDETVGINLKVEAHFFITKTLLDLHPQVTIPLDSKHGVDFKDFAQAVSASDPTSDGGVPNMALTTLHAGQVSDPQTYVGACLNEAAPPAQTPPSQPYKKGDPNLLNQNIYPCNICIGNPSANDPKTGQMVPAQAEIVFPSIPSAFVAWTCTPESIGCFDVCYFDPASKGLTIKQTALQLKLHNLAGKACNYKEPH